MKDKEEDLRTEKDTLKEADDDQKLDERKGRREARSEWEVGRKKEWELEAEREDEQGGERKKSYNVPLSVTHPSTTPHP